LNFRNFEISLGCKEGSNRVGEDVIDIIVDSGTRSHVVTKMDFIHPGSSYRSDTTVEVVGGRKLNLRLRGSVMLEDMGPSTIELKDTLVIPGGNTNLISMSRFDKMGFSIYVKNGLMKFTNSETKLVELTAELWCDELYHIFRVSEQTNSLNIGRRPYTNIKNDNREVPVSVLQIITNLLSIWKGKANIAIWKTPFLSKTLKWLKCQFFPPILSRTHI
jgi:hypothetical protein